MNNKIDFSEAKYGMLLQSFYISFQSTVTYKTQHRVLNMILLLINDT